MQTKPSKAQGHEVNSLSHSSSARTSKHAPAEVSSKKSVSRRRDVVDVVKPVTRDPRFESVMGPMDADKIRRKYAFLDSYRDKEIADLKHAVRGAKDGEDKDVLRRDLERLESKKRTDQNKEKVRDVVRKHRSEEKSKVENGKKPFYLKKRQIQEVMLREEFKSSKSSQIDIKIERRRKRQAMKERSGIPDMRRSQ